MNMLHFVSVVCYCLDARLGDLMSNALPEVVALSGKLEGEVVLNPVGWKIAVHYFGDELLVRVDSPRGRELRIDMSVTNEHVRGALVGARNDSLAQAIREVLRDYHVSCRVLAGRGLQDYY